MENFNTEVNIPPGAKVQFELHYQEMKWRKLGSYEHKIHLQPGRLAKHLEVSLGLYGQNSAYLYFIFIATTTGGVDVLNSGWQCSILRFGIGVNHTTFLQVPTPAFLMSSPVYWLP